MEKRAEEGAAGDSSLPAPQEFISEELLPVFRAAHTTVLCLDELIPGNLLGLLTCSAAAQPCLGPEFAVVTLNGIVQGNVTRSARPGRDELLDQLIFFHPGSQEEKLWNVP